MGVKAEKWDMEILPQADPDRWNASVSELGGGLFHNYHYSRSLYESAGGAAFFARWFDDRGQCVGACPGVVQSSRRWPLSALFKQAHLPAFPACHSLTGLPALLESLGTALAARGVMALTVDSYAAPPDCPLGSSILANQVSRAEFCLDLGASLDELWSGLAGTRRTQIRRAQRAGLTLKPGRTRADVDQLDRLIAGSAHRWRQGHGEPFETPRLEKLDLITRHLVERGLATVYLAEGEGGAISGNLVGLWNGQGYNLLAGSCPAGFKVGAASWLYWEIIKDLKGQGAREFNLGGVAPDSAAPGHPAHGLYDFKRDFGGRLVPCASPTYALRPGRYRWYERFRRLQDSLGRRMPFRR
jgi:hypothetical protein